MDFSQSSTLGMEDMPQDTPRPKSERIKPETDISRVESALAYAFEGLAKGKNEVLIEYHGQIYRLRATRNGGLILNK